MELLKSLDFKTQEFLFCFSSAEEKFFMQINVRSFQGSMIEVPQDVLNNMKKLPVNMFPWGQ